MLLRKTIGWLEWRKGKNRKRKTLSEAGFETPQLTRWVGVFHGVERMHVDRVQTKLEF